MLSSSPLAGIFSTCQLRVPGSRRGLYLLSHYLPTISTVSTLSSSSAYLRATRHHLMHLPLSDLYPHHCLTRTHRLLDHLTQQCSTAQLVELARSSSGVACLFVLAVIHSTPLYLVGGGRSIGQVSIYTLGSRTRLKEKASTRERLGGVSPCLERSALSALTQRTYTEGFRRSRRVAGSLT